MTETLVAKKAKETRVLNKETQDLMDYIRAKDKWFRRWLGLTAVAIALILCIVILRQNQTINKQNEAIKLQNEIALKNQTHIDCIVKLFTTPLPPNTRSRTISNPSTTCNINFVP